MPWADQLMAAGVAGFVLSDETAVGPHGVETVRWIRRLERAWLERVATD